MFQGRRMDEAEPVCSSIEGAGWCVTRCYLGEILIYAVSRSIASAGKI